jgi:hypothetical protein
VDALHLVVFYYSTVIFVNSRFVTVFVILIQCDYRIWEPTLRSFGMCSFLPREK